MSDDEQDFEEFADEIDSPKISALSLSVADKINIPTSSQQFADEFAAITEPFNEFQKARTAAIIEGVDKFHKARRDAIIEPLDGFQKARIDAIIEPFDKFHKARMDAIIDLPDEVFSTALTASTVSAGARTTSPPTPTPPSTEFDEIPADPSYDDIDAEVPRSLYLNSAYTLAQYIVYRIDGLSQQQRTAAAILIAAGIAAGAAQHHPRISETPAVAGSSVISVGMLLQLFWGVGGQD